MRKGLYQGHSYLLKPAQNFLHLKETEIILFGTSSVLNAALEFSTSTSRCERITPVLSSLQWLPGHFRIYFKLLWISL